MRLPGVESRGAVSILPLGGGVSWDAITIEGYDPATGQSAIQADLRIASVGYFETMRIPLIKGRFFNEQDRKDSPRIAIIDENMARTYRRRFVTARGRDNSGELAARTARGKGRSNGGAAV
jgi:hypothetical protein